MRQKSQQQQQQQHRRSLKNEAKFTVFILKIFLKLLKIEKKKKKIEKLRNCFKKKNKLKIYLDLANRENFSVYYQNISGSFKDLI